MKTNYFHAAGLGLLVTLGFLRPAVADDVRVNQLMLDIQEVQRTLRDQSRRIGDLERELAQYRVQGGPSTALRKGQALEPPGEEWLKVANWERVRPGMTAPEVIAILGTPASMRKSADSGTKTLFYARQIGASGFLGGTVVFQDDRVSTVSRPVLK